MTLLIAAVVTLVLTTVLSMAGVGAAFVLIPVFLALGVELHSAMATALLLNTIGMSIASFTFVRKGLVAWKLVVPMLLVAVLASPLGVRVGQGMDRAMLLWLFVGFLLFASSMMWFYRPKPRSVPHSAHACLILGMPVGAVAGAASLGVAAEADAVALGAVRVWAQPASARQASHRASWMNRFKIGFSIGAARQRR